MLDNYHTGAYGQVHQRKWSCCGAANRDSSGCQKTSTNSSRHRRRMTSVIESRSSSERVARRPFSSLYNHTSKLQEERHSPSSTFHDVRETPEESDTPQQIRHSLATSSLSELEQEESASEAVRKLMHQDSQNDNMG